MANSFPNRAIAVAMLVFFFALNTAAQDITQSRRELHELEIQMEKLRRAFPPSFTPDEQRKLIERRAKPAQLQVSVKTDEKPERLLFADGTPSPISVAHIDLSGRADHASFNFFLQLLDYGIEPVRIESATIKADGGGKVSFAARIAVAFYGADAGAETLPRSSDPAVDLRQRIRRMQDLIALINNLHVSGNARTFSDAMASISEGVGENAVALHEIRLGDEVTLEGEVAGAAARSALKSAMERAPFTLTDLTYTPGGPCRHFVAKAKLPPAKEFDFEADTSESDPVVVGNGLFTTSSCGREGAKTSAKPITVRGKSPGGVTIKLRDASAADLFYVLHDATGEDFVADGTLPARVTLTASDASVEETLAALSDVGLLIGPRPLRTVTARGNRPAASTEEMTGDKVSLLLWDAALQDVLCLFSNITGLPIGIDPATKRRVTIFANDVEWDRALIGILAVQGLRYRIDGTRALIGADEAALATNDLADPCMVKGDAENNRFSMFTVEQFDGSDLDLAGMARVDGSWRAYIRGPSGRLYPLNEGQKMLDATVQSIDSGGVTLSTKQKIGFE